MSERLAGRSGNGLLVVGVGASAGGVEALEHLFTGLPTSIGAAFVVITHLGPKRETLLAEILARHARMPVVNATDGMQLRGDHVYVLPSNAVLTMESLTLRLHPDPEHHQRNPIDVFFASMARAVRENAVGIVLSGAGSDGTLGVKGIKEEGGLTIAQGHDGAGPRHDSMPNSAISTGLVDLVVPVQDIGARLQEYSRSFGSLKLLVDDERRSTNDVADAALKDIYSTLRRRIGHDFEGYKDKTFLRRVQRRIHVLQMRSVTDYAERLRQDGDEASLLFRDLLIGVTSFFRDAEAFGALAAQVIPKLFENLGTADTVRVWVPGCSTGEEAYTLAILLREHMLTLDVVPKVQVFATDIDEPALATARSGRYPQAMLHDVSPERLQRFFREETASYVLTKEVRDLCIFSSHSVIRDPPFSRMDLVSCRNLLIYFNGELQDSVLPVFHYALRPGGYLFLGPSESISRQGEHFAVTDKKHRIFQRRPTLTNSARVPMWIPKGRRELPNVRPADVSVRKDQGLRQDVESSVLEHFAPAHIVTDADGDIVFYSARTGKYLEAQSGSPSRQILAMARKGLRLELRGALREAVEKRRTVVREHVQVELDDRVQPVRLTVQPILDEEREPLYLIVFSDVGPPLTREEATNYRSAGPPADIANLEQELRETRDRLQSTIEEYETALEELKSGNEELVSVNEELQSTNEELETSKEELQSVNEELQTVNHELAGKVDELHRSNADLRNLFESTQIATVFLDRFMLIRSFTPAVTAIFNLISGDRGRPITDIAHCLDDVDLHRDVRQVLDERKPLERPVRVRNGKVYHLMRILPYRTVDNEIDGVLVTFVNVTAVVVAEEQQRLLVSELNHRVRNMLQVVIGLGNQTLQRSPDLATFEKAFMGRMQALARAYELLSRDGWHEVQLQELVRTQLQPFVTERSRCSISGPAVLLSANAALAMGLVLYELATNATKYGALSVSTGRIEVTWQLEHEGGPQPELVFNWREADGPPVKPPTRQGFGSELVQRQLRYELNGKAAMEFAVTGLRVTFRVPAQGSLISAGEPAKERNVDATAG